MIVHGAGHIVFALLVGIAAIPVMVAALPLLIFSLLIVAAMGFSRRPMINRRQFIAIGALTFIAATSEILFSSFYVNEKVEIAYAAWRTLTASIFLAYFVFLGIAFRRVSGEERYGILLCWTMSAYFVGCIGYASISLVREL